VGGTQTGGGGATMTGAGRLMITGGGREIGKPIPILTLNPAWEPETAPSRTVESINSFFIHQVRRGSHSSILTTYDFL
jgi:hypothetical protein